MLAADIGGTSARFAIFNAVGEARTPVQVEVLPAVSFAGFREALAHVLDPRPAGIEAACIAVAGPVHGDHARLTNLPWHVDIDTVANQLAVPRSRVRLVNDLEAVAWAIPTLPPEALRTLHAGGSCPGNAALLAAGTGLGEAGMYWDGARYLPFACEGGHADFAPRDEIEWEYARDLMGRWGHASWERVLSGPGLVSLFEFLVRARGTLVPATLAERMRIGDPAAAVAEAALAGFCDAAVEAVDRFVALLGAEAGNLALKLLARGGVFVGGGMAPKLLPCQHTGRFVEGFLAKGRMRPLLETIPVHVILDETAGLCGAAAVAVQLLAGSGATPTGPCCIPARRQP